MIIHAECQFVLEREGGGGFFSPLASAEVAEAWLNI